MLFYLLDKLKSCKFHLSDSNQLLIETFITVRDDVEPLIQHLSEYTNSKNDYVTIRAWDRNPDYQSRSLVEKASRLIYLNKTCFNGLYRVNAAGEFNVPFGDYKRPTICDTENLRACSAALQDVTIQVLDYRDTLSEIQSQAFVYLDPPYEPLSRTSSFNSYTNARFDEIDQVRLFKFCQSLTRRRVRFLLSNSSSVWLRHLYEKDPRFLVSTVRAKRSINADKTGRGPIPEITVRNYRNP